MTENDAFIHYMVKNHANLSGLYYLLMSHKDLNGIKRDVENLPIDSKEDRKIYKLIKEYINKEQIIFDEEKMFFANLIRSNIKYTNVWKDDYPKRLLNLIDPPSMIYYKGNLPDENKFSVSIVGARECSDYGKRVALEFSGELAYNGVQIISGMARGVDGYAHRAAIRVGGSTYGILGTGVDIEYPTENHDIYRDIISNGGILSEFEPMEKPIGFHFPMRNRIISGLSDALLVVEARNKSGTLITVTQALEQGIEIYAVPGRISDGLSNGCNRLIQEGCNVALTPSDIIEGLKGIPNDLRGIEDDISANDVRLMECLRTNPSSFEEILIRKYFDGSEDELFEVLLNLQLNGKIYKDCDKYFINF